MFNVDFGPYFRIVRRLQWEGTQNSNGLHRQNRFFARLLRLLFHGFVRFNTFANNLYKVHLRRGDDTVSAALYTAKGSDSYRLLSSLH